MKIRAIKTRVFREKENLLAFILEHVKIIKEKNILVVTSKIVSLSQGRVRIIENQKSREQIIKEESDWALKTKYTWLTLKNGMLLKSSGIDQSNGNGKIILLPNNSFIVAKNIRKKLKKYFNISELGVIIVDSRAMFLKKGIIGWAIAYAGFKGLKSYVGQKDIFGRKLKSSKINLADSLAAASNLVMGEGDERRPLALISEINLDFIENNQEDELLFDVKEDLYGDFFRNYK